MIKVLVFGDVMGKPGRRAIETCLPRIRAAEAPDFVLMNGENSAGGFGMTPKIFFSLVDPLGINCITSGNHWCDKREILEIIEEPRLVIPANAGNNSDTRLGLKFFRVGGVDIAVLNVIGKVFMHPDNRCPFDAVDKLLREVPAHVRVRIVDVHGEASSEKQALGHYLDGRVSLVYGTHTHVPTADERLLSKGTGFVTDVGMTGPYDSVIGIDKDASILRIRTGVKKGFEPAKSGSWLCAMIAELDETTGHCKAMRRLIMRDVENM